MARESVTETPQSVLWLPLVANTTLSLKSNLYLHNCWHLRLLSPHLLPCLPRLTVSRLRMVDTVLLQPPGINFHHLPQLLVYLPAHLQASVVTTVLKAVTMVLKGTHLLQVSHQTEHHLALHRRQVSACLECLLGSLLLHQECPPVCLQMLTKGDETVI
jgi:hypothetical protein